MNFRKSILIFCLALFNHILLNAQEANGWTIMHYAVGSNSSEVDLLNDMNEMKIGKTSKGYEVITLIDRTPGFSDDSTALGENFIDTRLYRFENGNYERLDGHEFLPQIKKDELHDLEMGDANVLKRFIQYCKYYYPAQNYMLVLRSHGNGVGMCPDAESGVNDKLYPGELRDVLSGSESVDILGLDVCSMAGLENFYEWRPNDENKFSADYIIASAPLSAAWAYDHIFNKLQVDPDKNIDLDNNYFSPGAEQSINPYEMDALAFAKIIMEEIYDNQAWASWGLFDNAHIEKIKVQIDELSRLLVNEEEEVILEIIQNTLAYYHNTNDNLEIAQLIFPYLDAYHFYELLAANNQISTASRNLAGDICSAIDDFVIYSYYGQGYLPSTEVFHEGKSGVYQIIPMGNKIFSQSKRSFWSHTTWFHPDDQSSQQNAYGLYDWCKDGAIPANGKIENFFEYLDYLFDKEGTDTGGVNKYRY